MTERDARERESAEILSRIERESSAGAPGFMAGGFVGKRAGRLRDYLAAADAEPGDRIEFWGRVIGRAIGAVITLLILVYLLFYLFGG